MPDGTSRFSLKGEKIHHYMGCSTFANFTVLPEIAVAKIREDAPFDKVCYIGCGVTTGIGAVLNTAKVTPGAKCAVFGLGGIGLNVIQGLRLAGADMIIGVDTNNDKKAWGERFGMTHFVNPKEIGADLVPYLVNLTKTPADQIGGCDYTFECVGNVELMRAALESCHRGWGESIIIGVAPAGAEIKTRPFQLVTGPDLEGHRVRRRQGPHRRAEDRRLVHGRQDRDRPDDHPRDAAHRHQQGVRPDAFGREHPERGGLLDCAVSPARQFTSATPATQTAMPSKRQRRKLLVEHQPGHQRGERRRQIEQADTRAAAWCRIRKYNSQIAPSDSPNTSQAMASTNSRGPLHLHASRRRARSSANSTAAARYWMRKPVRHSMPPPKRF